MTKTERLEFDVERIENGYLVNLNYSPIDYSKVIYKRYFFVDMEAVTRLYSEYLAMLQQPQ